MIKGTYLSKSEKMFTWRVCCLSSLYPFAILTASLAWRGEVYSIKTYLKEREFTHFKNIYRAMLSLQTVFRRLYGWKARTYISTLHFIILKNNFLPFFKEDWPFCLFISNWKKFPVDFAKLLEDFSDDIFQFFLSVWSYLGNIIYHNNVINAIRFFRFAPQ